MLSRTEWLVLNATADDFENLEQIYRSINFEFCSEPQSTFDQTTVYWREVKDGLLLTEISDSIRELVHRGLLLVKPLESDHQRIVSNDLSFVWRGWFQMTPEARMLVESSPVP